MKSLRKDQYAFFVNGMHGDQRIRIPLDRIHSCSPIPPPPCIGLVNNFTYVVFLSAAQDILKESQRKQVGERVPESAILLADIVPGLLVKLVCPYFMHLVPYRWVIGAEIKNCDSYWIIAFVSQSVSCFPSVLFRYHLLYIVPMMFDVSLRWSLGCRCSGFNSEESFSPRSRPDWGKYPFSP